MILPRASRTNRLWARSIACSTGRHERSLAARSADFRSAISCLYERNPVAAQEFRRAIAKAAGLLAKRPAIARLSNYTGFRVWSLPRWSKVIIFRAVADDIEIARLLETRQMLPRTMD